MPAQSWYFGSDPCVTQRKVRAASAARARAPAGTVRPHTPPPSNPLPRPLTLAQALAISATCEGSCTDYDVPWRYGASWTRLGSRQVQYSCRAGYYNAGGSGSVSTCNGASFTNDGVTIDCRECGTGSYCPGDGQRYACEPGTFSYPWHTTATSRWCSGWCQPGYYCPVGAQSPYANACGGVDRYCPFGSAAPIRAWRAGGAHGWGARRGWHTATPRGGRRSARAPH